MSSRQWPGQYQMDAPGTAARAVTPSDGSDLPAPGPCRAIYVGTPGDLQVTLLTDTNPVTFVGMPAGLHPIAVKRVWLSGTTAGGIVAIY